MGFYGAAWDGERVRVEPLSLRFDLATHWKEGNARYVIASCFDAFVIATETIQAHCGSIYAEALTNLPPPQYDRRLQKARGYPSLTSYNDNGQEIRFR